MNLLNNSPPHAPGVLERDLWFHVQNSVKLGTFASPEPLQIQSTKQIGLWAHPAQRQSKGLLKPAATWTKFHLKKSGP